MSDEGVKGRTTFAPDRPGFKIGDRVWVQVFRQRMFPHPVAIEEVYKLDEKIWYRVEGSATGLTADNLTLAATEQTPPSPSSNPPEHDAWAGRAADIPIVEGGGPNPIEDLAAEFETTDAPLLPNKSDIAKHLYALFPPEFAKDFPDAWIEVAYGHAATGGAVNKAELFSVFHLQEAIEFAVKKNEAGFNLYVGPAMRQGEKPKSGRAKDTAVVTSAYAWAEFDGSEDGTRIDSILKEKNLRRAMIIVTGRTPHLRAHLYFKLAGSVTPDKLKAANGALKMLLGGDDVESPVHLMRLAGTVNYPTKDKCERGYVTELVTLHIRENAPAYTVEHLAGLAGKPSDKGNPSNGTFGFNTKAGRDDSELKALLEASGVQGKWHNSMRDAVATMIGRGWNDLQIKLACAAYCRGEADDPDLALLIEGARKKWGGGETPREGATQQQRRRETGTWDEPDTSILDDRRGDLPELPLNAFPAVMHGWIRSAARGAGVTADHIATPLIGIASSAIGIARRVQATKSWLTPMTCWACLVGMSGSGKTPAIDTVKRALSLIENNRRGEIAALQLAHETRVEAARAALKKWKDEVATAIENGQPPPPKPGGALDVGPFVAPRLYVNDTTIERLAALIEARPSGMTFIADELARLFLNMQRYSNGSDREFWLEAWDGKSFVVERQGRPSISVSHLLVGVIGGFQPDKLARSFEGDADGIYARFLFCWPREPAFAPPAEDVDEIDPEIINALGRLLRLPVIADGIFVPRNLPLSRGALAGFVQFLHFLHQRKAELDGREREYWCKGSAHVLRLAGTLCLLEWAWTGGSEPQAINAEHVESAVVLWSDYYWQHGCAALRQMGLSDRHVEARQVLRWVRANGRHEVSPKDVRRDALKQRLDAGGTQLVIDGLVHAGWLRQVTTRTPGRAIHRYEVNPQLFSLDLGAGSAGSAGRGASASATGSRDPLSALPALRAWGLGKKEDYLTPEEIEADFGHEVPGAAARSEKSSATDPGPAAKNPGWRRKL
jgi:hypothetical protein